MSYLALARKWRPRRFEDVRGQGHVVKALVHALDGDRLHPAILLTGTRGVGKTTLARIIAKGLNCETGVSAHPCGICTSCREVVEGRFVDLLEIDAASNTGVDNVRDLIDNATYSPSRGRYKVYLIDEVHMLSKGAFNALLKTLEEPPPHVKFILATTDPQKLPITVLSRCLQFSLKRLPPALIRDNLAEILKEEGVAFEPGALTEIARAADGSMRDGISLLDQAIAFSDGGEVKREPVEEMLGTGGRRNLLAVLEALASGDAAGLLAAIQRLDEAAPDYMALLNDLAAYLQRIAVLQILPDAADDEDDPLLAPLAQRLAIEDVQVWYQIAVMGRRDLPYAPDPRLGFEMSLLRMFALRSDESLAASAGSSGETKTQPATASAARAAPTPASVARATAASEPAISIAEPRPVAIVAATLVVSKVPPITASPAATKSVAPAPAQVAPAAVESPSVESDTDSNWATHIETLGLDGMARQLARHCAWLGEEGGAVRLAVDIKVKHLLNEERRAAIERALNRDLAAPIRVVVELGRPDGPMSPAGLEDRRVHDRQRNAELAIENDPNVRSFIESFGATVRQDSIQPID